MTSPSVDLDGIMPYGVTVSGGGSSGKAVFVTSSPRAANDSLTLPGGPARVSASWSGPEAVRLTLGGVGYPVQIPAGGGSAPGRLSSAQRAGTLSIWNPSTGRLSTRKAAAPSRCTHSRSSSRRGGGLNGRATRNAGRDSALRDSLQDGLRGLYGSRGWTAHYRRILRPARRGVPGTAGVYGAGGRRGVVEARRVRREDTQNVRYSGRFIRGAAQLQTANHSGERGGAVVDYDHTAPQRRRTVHLNRISTHLPTTQLAAGVVA